MLAQGSHAWTFLVKLKLDTLTFSVTSKEIQFNIKLKVVETDGGGEFCALIPSLQPIMALVTDFHVSLGLLKQDLTSSSLRCLGVLATFTFVLITTCRSLPFDGRAR